MTLELEGSVAPAPGCLIGWRHVSCDNLPGVDLALI